MRSPNKSRSRNKNQNRRSTTNVVNRVFDSTGPEGKVRGTPQQIIEKYQSLARDAQLSGDRVAAENFQQHSEHYIRLLGAAMREQAQRREQQDAQRRDQQQQTDNRQQQPQRQSQPQAVDPQNAEQPDIVDPVAVAPIATAPAAPEIAPEIVPAPEADNGLVDTPEDKPRRRRQTPRPARKAAPKAPPQGEDAMKNGSGAIDSPAKKDRPAVDDADQAAQ